MFWKIRPLGMFLFYLSFSCLKHGYSYYFPDPHRRPPWSGSERGIRTQKVKKHAEIKSVKWREFWAIYKRWFGNLFGSFSCLLFNPYSWIRIQMFPDLRIWSSVYTYGIYIHCVQYVRLLFTYSYWARDNFVASRQRSRASGTRTNLKNVKFSVSKRSIATTNIAIMQ